MVGEMVQNSQRLYSFTFNAVTVINEYIYSHPRTEFTFKKYIHLLKFTGVFHIQRVIFIHIHDRNIHSALRIN